LGWLLQALPAQILIKVSHKPGISNEPLFQIPLEIRIAAFSVVVFISMASFFEYRRPLFGAFALTFGKSIEDPKMKQRRGWE
jgi:hypothetical protein